MMKAVIFDISGVDEDLALESLVKLIESGFGE